MRDLLEEHDRGDLTLVEVSGGLLGALVNTDIDAQLAGLPPDHRDWVLWELRDHYAPIIGHEAEGYFILEGVCVSPAAREAYLRDLAHREEYLRTIEVPSIQRWLRAHPLPAREPFPTAIVRGLRARIESARQALWATRPGDLEPRESHAWARRERYGELLSLAIELKKAVERADRGGPGSQEQALAWHGLERVAGVLASREDLTAEEIPLVVEAEKRRREHLDSLAP